MNQPSRQAVLNFFRQQGTPRHARELAAHFRLKRRALDNLISLLEELVAEGSLVMLRGERYALPRAADLVSGTISIHRGGFAFVTPDQDAGGDVFVPARQLGGAMNGDKVQLSVARGRRGGNREGRVVKILERATTQLIGVYRSGRKHGLLMPLQSKERSGFEVVRGTAAGAEEGQLVVGKIDVYPEPGRPGRASVIRVLGDPDDPEVEVLAVAHRFGLPYEFSAAARSEAETIPAQVTLDDMAGRKDLRGMPFVTIDGETARDFDDAVALVEAADGYRLWVAIADVAHYVRPGSALDREALERGTSVYFPGRCLPMLPEQLSNGICSLNPGADRLVLVAEMLFNAQGEGIAADFYTAVITSKGRLTYRAVQQFFDQDEKWSTEDPELFPQLLAMAKLARCLIQRRQQRGSLDFELPEAEIILKASGRPETVRKAKRLFAHRLIEEFMLAANEAVAAHLERQQKGLLFRVHEPPVREKLEDFQQFVAHFNYGLRLDADRLEPRVLQDLLNEVKGSAEEKLINQVLLRSMKRASYHVENLGHFGLAAACYCHFTSPIRRYPDLVVHRVLRKSFRHQNAYSHESLVSLGDDLSWKERRAMEAERDLVALKQCQYMADRLGESFAGTISGVQPFGLFVELNEIFVEGMIHISALEDDYYHFDEELLRLVGYNRRRVFQVGDAVAVRLKRVDLEYREIDFALDEPDKPAPGRRPKGRR